MDVPPIESLARLAVSILATVTALILLEGWRRPLHARPLIRFLAVVLALNAAWRWSVLWIGLQPGDTLFGQSFSSIEPYIRTAGTAFLCLLYVGVALVALFHLRPSAT